MTITNPPAALRGAAPHRPRPSRDSRAWRARAWRADLVLVAIVATVALMVAWTLIDVLPIGSASEAVQAIGILAGLVATDLALVMVVLVSRARWIDRSIGSHVATRWHGALGVPVLVGLLVHGAALVVGTGLADGTGPIAALAGLLASADIALAVLSVALFLAVVGTSIAIVRRVLSQEAWWLVHLLSYLALGAALPHQLSTGGVLVDGSPQRWAWLALYAVAAGSILSGRVVRPIVRSLRHRLEIVRVEPAGRGAVHLWLAGRELAALAPQPGQFLRVRALATGLWWHSHPFSISAVRPGAVRLTIGIAGRGSAALAAAPLGTRVWFSGPHGAFTPEAKSATHTLLIGAGTGAAPLVAMLEALPGATTGMVLRAGPGGGGRAEGVLVREAAAAASATGAWIEVVDGARRGHWSGDRHGLLDGLDLRDADVFVCGPSAWMADVRAELVHRVPAHRIHLEDFAWDAAAAKEAAR